MGIPTRPASKRHTIHFGSNLGQMQKDLPSEKDGRAQVSSRSSHLFKRSKSCDKSDRNPGDMQSTTIAVNEVHDKGPRSLFGSVRNRRSVLGTPAGDSNYGRKSSASVMLRDMGRSSKDFFNKLTTWKKGMSL